MHVIPGVRVGTKIGRGRQLSLTSYDYVVSTPRSHSKQKKTLYLIRDFQPWESDGDDVTCQLNGNNAPGGQARSAVFCVGQVRLG